MVGWIGQVEVGTIRMQAGRFHLVRMTGCIVAVGMAAGAPATVDLSIVVEIFVGLFSAVATAAVAIEILLDQ